MAEAEVRRTGSGPADADVEPQEGRRAARRGGRWSWKIGRLFGIEIRVHATLLLLLVWVVSAHLSSGQDVKAALDGILLVLAVFAVIVIHEMAHALTARRFGIRTRDIMLLPIGGVSSLERMPEEPGQELMVAIAGPLTNVVIAGLVAGVIAITKGRLDLGGTHMVGGPFLAKLFWINISLAVFNLLPAFPMDGGRVLRSALALRLDRERATDLAARIGQAMAVILGILGLLVNTMLVLIAVFVWFGAWQERAMLKFDAAIRGIPVRNAMITDFKTVGPDDTLGRAAELLASGFQSVFPVVEDGRAAGILTLERIVEGLGRGGPDVRAGAVADRVVVTAAPADMTDEALRRSRAAGSPVVLVTNGPVLVGLLTSENIREVAALRQALRDAAASAHTRANG